MTTADVPAHACEPPAPASAARAVHLPAWSRVVVWWDVSFYVLALLAALTFVIDGAPQRALAIQLACVGAIVLAYALLGARAARTRERGRTWAYLAVLVVATTVAMTQGTLAEVLLFASFAQAWMLSERPREGVVTVVLLVVGATAGMWAASGWSTSVIAHLAPSMAVTFVFAVALGLWFARTIRQAEDNARLVDELRAAQAELAATQHAAGVAAERERVAREIHDTLAQGFMSVVTLSQVATAALDRGDASTARERLATVEATARDNLAEARGLVAAFAPVPLQGTTLADALRRLADRWSAETGLHAVVEVDAAAALAPGDEVVLLRAAQEALTNARRHAGARAVWISLEGGGDGPVRLEIVDDGTGIVPGTPDGFGLRGMRERVAAAGGTLAIGSGDDGGTSVTVTLPVRAGS